MKAELQPIFDRDVDLITRQGIETSAIVTLVS
jgi:predicted nucleotidyltransferase